MMPRVYAIAMILLALAASHAWAWRSGWLAGAEFERGRWAAEKVRILEAAEARAAALRADGDRLAAELERAKAAVRVEYVDRVRTVVKIASATRECLRPDVTAALNRAPIRETVERPGEPPRVVEPPAPTGGTSEAAAAEWIATAQAEHSACRAQVASLVAWVKSVTGSAR